MNARKCIIRLLNYVGSKHHLKLSKLERNSCSNNINSHAAAENNKKRKCESIDFEYVFSFFPCVHKENFLSGHAVLRKPKCSSRLSHRQKKVLQASSRSKSFVQEDLFPPPQTWVEEKNVNMADKQKRWCRAFCYFCEHLKIQNVAKKVAFTRRSFHERTPLADVSSDINKRTP